MRTGLLIALGIIIGSTFSTFIAMAWTAPTAAPPGGNVASPVNVGSVMQLKNGTLGVNGLGVFGNTILSGTNGDGTGNGVNSYLNFGSTAGQASYGVRDNNGTLEFKNNGGSWATLQSTIFNFIGGGPTWAVSSNGTDIHNANTGNVGVGTASPTEGLTVKTSSAPFSLQDSANTGTRFIFDTTWNGTADILKIINPHSSGSLVFDWNGNVGIGSTNPTSYESLLGRASPRATLSISSHNSAADLSVERWLHNFGRCGKWNFCLTTAGEIFAPARMGIQGQFQTFYNAQRLVTLNG